MVRSAATSASAEQDGEELSRSLSEIAGVGGFWCDVLGFSAYKAVEKCRSRGPATASYNASFLHGVYRAPLCRSFYQPVAILYCGNRGRYEQHSHTPSLTPESAIPFADFGMTLIKAFGTIVVAYIAPLILQRITLPRVQFGLSRRSDA